VTVTSLGGLPDSSSRRPGAAWRNGASPRAATEGSAKAEATADGIVTVGLSSKRMAAVKVPGLHAIGEGVDVTGWLGGYNFQWAWASGVAAGEAV